MISKNFNSNKFESVMCAIFSKDYDHNISIDELKDVLYSHNEEFIVKELNIIEENKYIRDKSKWEVSVTIEYIPIDEEYNDDIEDEVGKIVYDGEGIAPGPAAGRGQGGAGQRRAHSQGEDSSAIGACGPALAAGVFQGVNGLFHGQIPPFRQ